MKSEGMGFYSRVGLYWSGYVICKEQINVADIVYGPFPKLGQIPDKKRNICIDNLACP